MTTTDLSSDDNLLTSSEPTHAELAREFTNPGHTFKGETLKPYTAGTDLLFTQVLDRNDATMTAIMSFIFIHRTKIKRDDLLALCWDKPKFRAALLDWIDSIGPLSKEDHAAADEIFLSMRTGAQKAEVEVAPDPSDLTRQKKTKASRRPKSRS